MALSLNLQNNFNFSNKGCYTLKWDIFPLPQRLHGYNCNRNRFFVCAKPRRGKY